MRRILFAIVALISLSVFAVDIIPVKQWPKTIYAPDKIITVATISECVKAGYRLLTAKPATPGGKRIKSEKIVQDDKDPAKCKYDIVYEDIPEPPEPPVIVPEVLVIVPATNIVFWATTSGVPRSWKLKNAPASNNISEIK